MTCKINADTTDGLKIVSDTSGEIEIQDNGTTRLTIGDTIDIQGTELVLDADADTSIHASTDDQIDFKLGGSDRIIFTSSGISTTNSGGIAIGTEDDNAAIFEISGAASGDEGGEIRLDTAADHDGTYQFYRIDVNQDDLRIGREGNTDVTFNSDGKVGIGITSPTGKLAVSDGTTTTELNPTSGIGFIGNRSNHPVVMQVNASEKMRIGTNGNITIGKTSESYGTDGWCIKQNGRMHSSVSVSDDNIALDKDGNGNFIYFSTATSQRGQISYDGSNVLYGTSSDYRLKENVDYSFDATTRLKQLKPCRFNWISDDTNTAIDGFIAHEVSNVVPNAVYGDKDGTKTTTKIVKDKDGLVIEADIEEADWTEGKSSGIFPSDSTWTASESKEEYQTLDPSKLVPLLVKTIQELEARITALES